MEFYNIHFNPRSPRRERLYLFGKAFYRKRFQSTLPAKGATAAPRRKHGGIRFQSTLPAKGATGSGRYFGGVNHISIHAPREGSDHLDNSMEGSMYISIHAPREGSDGRRRCIFHLQAISIHAPREGSDARHGRPPRAWYHFNPRSPRRERQFKSVETTERETFQSTLPAKGAT